MYSFLQFTSTSLHHCFYQTSKSFSQICSKGWIYCQQSIPSKHHLQSIKAAVLYFGRSENAAGLACHITFNREQIFKLHWHRSLLTFKCFQVLFSNIQNRKYLWYRGAWKCVKRLTHVLIWWHTLTGNKLQQSGETIEWKV